MPPAARSLGVLAAIALAVWCQTVSDPLPPQASLNVDITDTALAPQASALPAPQIVSWQVDELSASNITSYSGTFSFLYSGPCFYQMNSVSVVSFGAACRTSGLTLEPRSDVLTASMRVSISRLELRAAARPDLTLAADPDGDGVPNSVDNCPIVYNPDQKNSNAASEILQNGDACSKLDSSGAPTIPDQDVDGVSDFFDNCLWYPSPVAPGDTTPADGNNNDIGDVCERIAPVVLPSHGLTLQCDDVEFTAEPSKLAFFRLDFGRPGVLTCDAGFTGCTLDPSRLKLTLVGSSSTFDCNQVP